MQPSQPQSDYSLQGPLKSQPGIREERIHGENKAIEIYCRFVPLENVSSLFFTMIKAMGTLKDTGAET